MWCSWTLPLKTVPGLMASSGTCLDRNHDISTTEGEKKSDANNTYCWSRLADMRHASSDELQAQSTVSLSHTPPNVCLLHRALDELLAHTSNACATADCAHIHSSAPTAYSGKIGASHGAVSLACTPPAQLKTGACTHGQQARTGNATAQRQLSHSGAHRRPPLAPHMCKTCSSKTARETHSSTYAWGTGSGAHASLVSPAHVRLEPVARSFLSRWHVLDFRVPAACRHAAGSQGLSEQLCICPA